MKSIAELPSRLLRLLPDKPYLYLFFYLQRKELLRLKNPVKYSQKIQWLKLYGNLERFAPFADKYTVRSYIEATIGAQYLVPLLGVWDQASDIPFDALPEQFVLKATHGSGYNYICRDKSKLDVDEVRSTLDKWLREDFYRQEREPQYRGCMPRIVCEAYLEDESGGLRDFKFFCAGGVPKVIEVDTDRFTDHKSDLLDTNWNKLSYVSVATFGPDALPPKRPANLTAMLSIATKLSRAFPFVRVDLYSAGSKIYFGELTFTPGSGIIKLTPETGDEIFGNLVDLSAYSAA
jgi:hypothetical protein